MDKNEKYYKLITIIVFLIIAFLVWLGRNNETNTLKKYDFLMLNGEFNIGIVTGDGSSTVGSNSRRTDIMYEFKSNNYWINSGEAGFLKKFNKDWSINFISAEKGEMFFVLYEKGNEQNSILCLDKPIKSKADFKKYREEVLKSRSIQPQTK